MRLGKDEWNRWAISVTRVQEDLQSTVNDRAVFAGFKEVVRSNGDWIDAHEGGFFCQFVLRSYIASIALGVRRQLKHRDDSISLMHVLSQMKECAPQLSFEFYLERFPRDPDYVPWQEPTFKLVSEDGRFASERIISGDIEELKKLTSQVEAFVDRTLAHLDPRGFDGNLSVDEIENAVDALDRIACKYICLLTGKGYRSLEATIQFDWKKIFSVPLCKPA